MRVDIYHSTRAVDESGIGSPWSRDSFGVFAGVGVVVGVPNFHAMRLHDFSKFIIARLRDL